jgi:hypothetical protein
MFYLKFILQNNRSYKSQPNVNAMKNTSNARFINLLLEELNYHHAEISKMEAILMELNNLSDTVSLHTKYINNNKGAKSASDDNITDAILLN